MLEYKFGYIEIAPERHSLKGFYFFQMCAEKLRIYERLSAWFPPLRWWTMALTKMSAGHVHRRAEALRESPRLFTRDQVANPIREWAVVFSRIPDLTGVCSTMDCCQNTTIDGGRQLLIKPIGHLLLGSLFDSFRDVCINRYDGTDQDA